MNYRDIVKSRDLRSRILRSLSFIPDKPMIMLQYYLQLGRKLNLKNPQRYTEKIQKYKLEYRNSLMVKCVDKWEVREYIKHKGFESILNKSYGVFSNVNDLDFEEFPQKFVLKDTLGGGGNRVIIVNNQQKPEDVEAIKARLQEWVDTPHRIKSGGREWPYYSGKKHRIIAEEYIENGSEELTDYKFFCFKGSVACVYVISNRTMGGHGELAIMNKYFKRIPYQSATQEVMKENPKKPRNYEFMIKVAEELSCEFPHVRVDLYNVNGRVIFGELTFFGASGYQRFVPDEFDFILGREFDI